MSVIAPIAALTTALVPLVVDVIDGVSLPGGRWAGVGLALIAIPALSYRRDEGDSSRPLTLSLRQELTDAVLAGRLRWILRDQHCFGVHARDQSRAADSFPRRTRAVGGVDGKGLSGGGV